MRCSVELFVVEMRWLGASNRDAIASHDGRSPSVFEPEPDVPARSQWSLAGCDWQGSNPVRLHSIQYAAR